MITLEEYFLLTKIICMIVISGFLAWVLYYVALFFRDLSSSARDFRNMTTEARNKMQDVFRQIESVRSQIATSFASVEYIFKFASRFAESWLKRRKENKPPRKK